MARAGTGIFFDGATSARRPVLVELSPEAAAAVVDNSTLEEGRAATDLAFELDRSAEGVYPIVLVSYQVACQSQPDATVGSA